MFPAPIAESQRLCIRFGADDRPGLALALPVLGGEGAEDLFPQARNAGRQGPFAVFRQNGWLLGRACLPAGDRLERSAREAYEALLGLVGGQTLVRIWNYVPQINEPGHDGLEHYRAFCRGRSLAFEQALGPGFKRHAPAGSAVGADGDELVVAFAAHSGAVRHVENPQQTPAYEYPVEHGPRPPTFARASVVTLDDETHAVFVSGTAAIRGHETVAPGDTGAQLECTIDNLRAISRACGLGADLGAGRVPARHVKVYVRHASAAAEVQARLEATLVRPEDRVCYLRSDVCRRELNVEIEVSLPQVRLG